jgi:hypothetical protein
VRRECAKRGWRGVGEWKFVCGDAKRVLVDEAVVDNINRDGLFVLTFDGTNSTTVSSLRAAQLCLLSTCDIVFMNNWAFDDVLSNDIVAQYGERAPAGGRGMFIRNPSPRHRPGSAGPLALFELPRFDAQVYDVPADGIHWCVHAAVERA